MSSASCSLTPAPLYRPASVRSRPAALWLPAIAGWLTALVGLLNLASTLTPDLAWRMRLLLHLEPGEFVPLAHAVALPSGVALIAVAYHLGRGHRRAWWLALSLLVVLGFLNIAKGLDVEEALVSWALAAILWWGRDGFVVRGDDRGVGRAVADIAVIAAAAFTAALLAVVAVSDVLPQHVTPWIAAREAIGLLTLTGGPLAFPGHTHWVPVGVELLGAGGLIAAAYVIFRPLAAPRELPAPAVRSLAADLVRRHGDDTLSFFKLRTDKHYLFSADHRAFVGYRVEGGVLLLSGDPVGPADAIPGLLEDAIAFADVRGLRVAVLGASERLLPIATQAGLRGFYIGDEAIVETARFSLEGRAIRKVRQSVTRLEKAGYTAQLLRLGDIDDTLLEQLEAVSERWRDGQPEKGFSMAMDSLGGEHQADCFVLVARDEAGAVRGFLHFVPTYRRPAVSLGFMRRDRETPNGLTEFMVVRAVQLLGERGVEEVSLNFATMARVLLTPAGRGQRIFARVLALANPYFQIESLYRFNAKFLPRWESRYLLYEGAFGLPRAALATLWAEGQLPKLRLGAGRGRP
jgi:lysyl-tRNA synthetase class 2